MRKFKLHHLSVWMLFFAGWYYFREGDYPNPPVALQITAVKVAVLASLVYTTNYLLIPRLLNRRRYILFAIIYLGLITAMGILKISVIMHLLQPYYSIPLRVFDNFKTRAYDNIIPLFLLVSTGAAARLVQQYIADQQRLAMISQEKISAELQYLRSQINPHFLFNMLNSIYFQIDKENVAARDTLIRFSDLLRYQLYDCNAEKTPVEKELRFLQDFIELQRLRLGESYEVTFRTSGALQEFEISPLLLIPFVENAFKHVSHHTDRANYIRIALTLEPETLRLKIVNSIDEPSLRSRKLHIGGIGLANVRRRLELLYPNKHALVVNEQDEEYIVELELSLR